MPRDDDGWTSTAGRKSGDCWDCGHLARKRASFAGETPAVPAKHWRISGGLVEPDSQQNQKNFRRA